MKGASSFKSGETTAPFFPTCRFVCIIYIRKSEACIHIPLANLSLQLPGEDDEVLDLVSVWSMSMFCIQGLLELHQMP